MDDDDEDSVLPCVYSDICLTTYLPSLASLGWYHELLCRD